MAIIEADTRIRKVELTGDELELVITELKCMPHNIFEFLKFKDIVKKLKIALNKK